MKADYSAALEGMQGDAPDVFGYSFTSTKHARNGPKMYTTALVRLHMPMTGVPADKRFYGVCQARLTGRSGTMQRGAGGNAGRPLPT